jgi:hypothetical protein
MNSSFIFFFSLHFYLSHILFYIYYLLCTIMISDKFGSTKEIIAQLKVTFSPMVSHLWGKIMKNTCLSPVQSTSAHFMCGACGLVRLT